MRGWTKRLWIGLIVWIALIDSVDAKMSSKEEAYFDYYRITLQMMKKKVEDVPNTGDATLDFLYEMIPLHEASIAMCENIMRFSDHSEVKQIAKKIVHNQLIELDKMKVLLEKTKEHPHIELEKEEAYLEVYKDSFQQMIKKMERAGTKGDINRHFLEEMISLHEGAVEMEITILQFTNNGDLRRIARTMLVDQKTQLIQMQRVMKMIE
ncbi:MAG TPA: DUF305 domain-containing protein [Ureibacillus sp.]|uniref:DUF305 domain-containing protein n=1 Tax=Peribacillus asahii TaxID=228899 RepID=UPI00207A3D2D|nr:DUF305 domain-containing protein [Peribacillus asahii]USK59819.1 DUF305 domain-containing protein [Peribacillus asahii]HWL27256.1 DUF305 domain-containing protein [Ureibacillus sp.]